MPHTRSGDASSPFPWPPVIYGTAVIAAGVLSWLAGWPFLPAGELRAAGLVGGVALIAIGIGLAVAAGSRFNAAGTPIPPNRPTKAIVTTGIYRFTRNPMYYGMTLVLGGLGFAFNQLWFLAAVPIAIFAVTKLAIEREEAYLEAKFGDEYRAYTARVRRWQ